MAPACIREFRSPDSSRTRKLLDLRGPVGGMTSAIGCAEFSVGTVPDVRLLEPNSAMTDVTSPSPLIATR